MPEDDTEETAAEESDTVSGDEVGVDNDVGYISADKLDTGADDEAKIDDDAE
jgi:hypothetical protein